METSTSTTTTVPAFHRFSIGDGATVCGYSDRTAYTVVAVSPSGKTITLQRDRATLQNAVGSGAPDALRFSPGGFVGHVSGVQRYTYESDATLPTMKARVRKNGQWACAGGRVVPGRSEHYDFNF